MLPTIHGVLRAGADPELRFTPSGKAVASLRAVGSRNRRLEDGTWETVRECWLNVQAWEGLAEFIAENLSKGQQFHLLGEIYEREYETNEGEKRKVFEVVANAVTPIPRRERTDRPPVAPTEDRAPWDRPSGQQSDWNQSDDPPF